MPYLSIYRGIVSDRKDPDKKGRLKLKVPVVYGDDTHDYWALPRGLFSSDGLGLMTIPEVGATVWVQFEAGDHRYPVWEQGPWDNTGIDSAYDDSGEPTKVTLRTKSGQLIVIDDTAKTIELIHSSGRSIKLDDGHISLVSDSTKSISLGSDQSSAQPGVLGDKNAEVLEDLVDACNDLASGLQADIIASFGQPYLVYPSNTLSKVTTLMVSLAQVKVKIAQTKSDKVTLD